MSRSRGQFSGIHLNARCGGKVGYTPSVMWGRPNLAKSMARSIAIEEATEFCSVCGGKALRRYVKHQQHYGRCKQHLEVQ